MLKFKVIHLPNVFSVFVFFHQLALSKREVFAVTEV